MQPPHRAAVGSAEAGQVSPDGAASPVFVGALQLPRERQSKSRASARECRGLGLVFSTEVATPIHPRNHYRTFQLIVERAGLRRVRLHDLRHSRRR